VAFGGLEQQVVVTLGIERWVEVDQVHAFRGDGSAQDLEVVAEIELVHPRKVYQRFSTPANKTAQ
jgi:hypothetical protein